MQVISLLAYGTYGLSSRVLLYVVSYTCVVGKQPFINGTSTVDIRS